MISLISKAARLTRYNDRHGGVDCAFSGTLFERDLAQLRIDLLRHIERHALHWMTVDIRQATLIVDESAALPLTTVTAADAPLRLRPVAVVVKPELETLCLQWQWEMAHEGFMRGVFLDPQEASRWCRSRSLPDVSEA
jgi:hypothetical protein